MQLSDIMALRGGMPKSLHMDLSPKALESWKPGINADTSTDENTISILDVIGTDYWGEGVSAKRISAALRSIGKDKPVTVFINSPGGDMFEGIAINNLLQQHEGKVTVKILALAASAASVIAMGADEIQIARGAFFMIHNAWVIAAGNRNEFREVADWLEPFDFAMADIYADRTGQDPEAVIAAMDKESWIGGSEAVELGYADSVIDFKSDDSEEGSTQASSVRKLELALAKAGMPRTERRKLINEFKASTPGAADNGTPGATGRDTHDAVALKETAALAAALSFSKILENCND